jgi:hypothetical protein
MFMHQRSVYWVLALMLTACLSLRANDDVANNWPKPETLISQLESLKEIPAAKSWVDSVLITLDELSTTEIESRQAGQHLSALNQLVNQLPNIAQASFNNGSTESLQNFSDLSRMHYRMSRRLLIWNQTYAAILASQSRPPQVDSKSAGYQRITFDGLDPRWVEYLCLPELKDQLNSLQPDAKERMKVARKILGRTYSPIHSADQANFIEQMMDPGIVNLLKDFATERPDYQELIRRLEQYDGLASSHAGYHLNNQYQNLLWSDHETDRQLAEYLDTHYRNANFRLSVSDQLMNRLIPDLPATSQPVSENVGDAVVSGQSQIWNQLRVNLVPNQTQAIVQIETNGVVQADTVARTKTFRVQNRGEANFQVIKQVNFGVDGIDATAPAYSQAMANQNVVGLQSTLDNIPIFGNVARKLAEKKLRDDAPKNNQVFQSKVSASAEQRVEQEIQSKLAKLRYYSHTNLLQPLIAMELEPKAVQMATTDNQFIMRYRIAGRDQMAANSARPRELKPGLMGFQIHQSAINNAIARLGLNGKTFTSKELKAHLQETLGFEGKADADAEDQRKAKFAFASLDPIRIDFIENRFNVILNLKGLKIGDKGKTWRNVSLTASYEPSVSGMQVLLRQDDDGTRIKGRRLRISDKAAISTVMKVLFKQEYQFQALPKKMYARLNGDFLQVSELAISNGWLGITIDDQQVQPINSVQQEPPRLRVGGGLRRMLNRK